ncbi:MAG: M2 family metallopeptidase [Gemmatimonadetes bacterium]|nr:M2 family metallopeptidase [Gemmatimonadota bacterium]
MAARSNARTTFALVAAIGIPIAACDAKLPDDDLSGVLDAYGREYRTLRQQAGEADWLLNTRIIPGDTTAASRSERAHLALAELAGDPRLQRWLRRQLEAGTPTPIERRQLEAILRSAAPYAAGYQSAVARRIRLENRQVETLFGFDFRVDGRSVTTSQIDGVLRTSRDEAERLKAWEASKEVGEALRPRLLELRDARNEPVRAFGYEDFADFKASAYEVGRDELLALTDELVADVWPLYRELHTWARYELADRYGAEVPTDLPAHWLPDRWGADWSALIESNRAELDRALAGRAPEWIVREAETFYRSVGFEPLPESFYERSSLYPAPPEADYRKNTHASAWHIDLERDVRALMSVEADARWYETTHHELGHIYYYLSYGRPEVPVFLRTGANRALHEAVGSLLGLASMQGAFLESRGLISGGRAPDDRRRALMREALRFVVFTPFSAGVMTRYEDELYRGAIDERSINRRWWELVRAYQGIAPPTERGERYADAASKTHITNDPAEYYDYAIAHALLFQLHDRIASDVLGQSPHDTNYFGEPRVGDVLRPLLEAGATRPWQSLIREATGEDLDGRAMAEYFSPLLERLREENRGRTHTLPSESPRG